MGVVEKCQLESYESLCVCAHLKEWPTPRGSVVIELSWNAHTTGRFHKTPGKERHDGLQSFIAVWLAAAVYLSLLLLGCFLASQLCFIYKPKEPSVQTHLCVHYSIPFFYSLTLLFCTCSISPIIHKIMDMAMPMATPLLLLLAFLLTSSSLLLTVSGNFYNDFDITWGNDRAQILDNGNQLQLTLDHTSGTYFWYLSAAMLCSALLFSHFIFILQFTPSFLWWQAVGFNLTSSSYAFLSLMTGCGFQSKQQYLYAKIDMQIKLVPGNSAGTVTAYYVCIITYSYWITSFIVSASYVCIITYSHWITSFIMKVYFLP